VLSICQESNEVFSFHLGTDFLLVYRSAFAQIFPRSQPMRQSNTSNHLNLYVFLPLYSAFFKLGGAHRRSFLQCFFNPNFSLLTTIFYYLDIFLKSYYSFINYLSWGKITLFCKICYEYSSLWTNIMILSI
jgi:hypothetical protein